MCPRVFSDELERAEKDLFKFESNSFIPSYLQAIFIPSSLGLFDCFESLVEVEVPAASGLGREARMPEMSWPAMATQPPSFLVQSVEAVATPSAKKHLTMPVHV